MKATRFHVFANGYARRLDETHIGFVKRIEGCGHTDPGWPDNQREFCKSEVALSVFFVSASCQSSFGDVGDVVFTGIDFSNSWETDLSNPVTLTPAEANETASGNPTYPRPTMPTWREFVGDFIEDVVHELFESVKR